ncbi:sigma factor G inhibitor Gin [Staphylospora marina]|uniref:sigma factor G inhibitor Gin n=1 Tax=Staphylospora marina TaxID=2490858 RepID=UPI0013DDB258|nr:sigma factor G inhibitor Gin [Staphylospora marina]
MQKSRQVETCLICGQERPQGIRLLNRFICDSCEQEMMVLEPGELRYNYIVWRLIPLWMDLQETRLA